MKVLIVDDCLLELAVTKDAFTKAKHYAKTIDNIFFVGLVRTFQPEVILLDVHLGDDLGPSVIPRIRALNLREQPLILLYSSSARDQLDTLTSSSGADGYILKAGPKDIIVNKTEVFLAARRDSERLMAV